MPWAMPGEARLQSRKPRRASSGRRLDEAHRQQALSWELRAATSLAHLLRQQGQPADAIACLEPVYGRFTECFDTADLIAAKRILDDTDRH
jgi:predicted ATPase